MNPRTHTLGLCALLAAGCEGSRGASPASSSTPVASTPGASVLVPASASSAPTAATTKPADAQLVAAGGRPAWASTATPQAGASALFARGAKGPVPAGFEGVLACSYAIRDGVGWDPILPFVGSPSDALPDAKITLGDRDAVARGPMNTATGHVVFGGVRLEPSSTVRVRVDDHDDNADDHVGEVTLDASKGFPLEAATAKVELACRGVPFAALAADLAAREAALARALDAMDSAGKKLPIAPTAPDVAKAKPAVAAAQAAALELAALTGFARPSTQAACERITAFEGSLGASVLAGFVALAEKPGDADGWRALPSVRVRPDAIKPGRFELVPGPAGAAYDWRAKTLGRVAITGVGADGERRAPAFVSFYVDGRELEGLEPKLAPGQVVTVEITMQSRQADLRVIVLEEGASRVAVLSKQP